MFYSNNPLGNFGVTRPSTTNPPAKTNGQPNPPAPNPPRFGSEGVDTFTSNYSVVPERSPEVRSAVFNVSKMSMDEASGKLDKSTYTEMVNPPSHYDQFPPI
jgi:hypothetical protein